MRYFLAVLFFGLVWVARGQEGFHNVGMDTLPNNKHSGTAYAMAWLPDIYELANGQKVEIFTKKKLRVTIQPQTIDSSFVVVLPTKLVRKDSLVLPKQQKILDPEYNTVIEHLEVVRTYNLWLFKRGSEFCLGIHPDYAQIFVLVEVRAQYQSVAKSYEMLRPPRKVIGKDTIALEIAEITQYFSNKTETKTIKCRRILPLPKYFTLFKDTLSQAVGFKNLSRCFYFK